MSPGAVRAVLDQLAARAVMTGRAAECRERMLLQIDLLVLVIGLVFIGDAGFGRDAIGELVAVNDAQIVRVVPALSTRMPGCAPRVLTASSVS